MFGDLLKIVLIRHGPGEAEEPGIALFGDVDVVVRIGATHVQRGGSAIGPHHAEGGQKFLLRVQIGCAQATIGEISDFDDGHG